MKAVAVSLPAECPAGTKEKSPADRPHRSENSISSSRFPVASAPTTAGQCLCRFERSRHLETAAAADGSSREHRRSSHRNQPGRMATLAKAPPGDASELGLVLIDGNNLDSGAINQ